MRHYFYWHLKITLERYTWISPSFIWRLRDSDFCWPRMFTDFLSGIQWLHLTLPLHATNKIQSTYVAFLLYDHIHFLLSSQMVWLSVPLISTPSPACALTHCYNLSQLHVSVPLNLLTLTSLKFSHKPQKADFTQHLWMSGLSKLYPENPTKYHTSFSV